MSDLFENEQFEQLVPKVSLDGLNVIEFFIPGDPIPKQSVRGMVNRWRSEGTHIDVVSGQLVQHRKGDAIVFKNSSTGAIDCQIMFYPDSKLEKLKKSYQQVFQSVMNVRGIQMFEEQCHILEMHFRFEFLKGHSDKFKGRAMLGDPCCFKTTKPDMPDNLKKLVLDAMSGIVFKDDGLICTEHEVMKYYGPNPGTYIKIAGK